MKYKLLHCVFGWTMHYDRSHMYINRGCISILNVSKISVICYASSFCGPHQLLRKRDHHILAKLVLPDKRII